MNVKRGMAIILVVLMVALNMYVQVWLPIDAAYAEDEIAQNDEQERAASSEKDGQEKDADSKHDGQEKDTGSKHDGQESDANAESVGQKGEADSEDDASNMDVEMQQVGAAELEASGTTAEKTLDEIEKSGGLVLMSASLGSEDGDADFEEGSTNSLKGNADSSEGSTNSGEGSSGDGSNVGGNNGDGDSEGEPVTENLEDEERPDAVVDGSGSGTSSGDVTLANSNKVTLQYSRTIYYENYKTHYFRAKCSDGTHVAYCVQPSVAVADRGTYDAVKATGSLLTKALYYSYGYPGYSKMKSYLAGQSKKSCYKGNDGAYALCHMMLSYVYDGKKSSSDAFTGVSSSTKSLVKRMTSKMESWPAPVTKTTLKLSPSKVKAGWKQSTKRQITPVMKLSGTKNNSITVKVPKYTKMIRKNGKKTLTVDAGSSTKKTVKVTTGQSFYFTAAASKRGTYTSPEMKGTLKAFRPYFIKVTGKQDIVYGIQKSGSVSFKITWLKFGKLSLTKKSTKSDFTNGNPQYSLKGARYVLLDKKGNKMGLLTTNASGKASLGNIPYGTYTLKETKASQGFSLDVQSYSIKLNNAVASKEVPEKPLIPKLRTSAADKESNSHEVTASGNMNIIDTVKYSNLIPGKTYQISGVLMDKSTWEAVPGARKTHTFTPDKSSGTVKVAFAFDGSDLGGSTVVAFEKLYLVDEKTGEKFEEAKHEDMEDEAQSVVIKKPKRHVPEETPDKPDQPDYPGDTPATYNEQVPMDHSPKTGDDPPYGALALAMLAALGFGFTTLLRRS